MSSSRPQVMPTSLQSCSKPAVSPGSRDSRGEQGHPCPWRSDHPVTRTVAALRQDGLAVGPQLFPHAISTVSGPHRIRDINHSSTRTTQPASSANPQLCTLLTLEFVPPFSAIPKLLSISCLKPDPELLVCASQCGHTDRSTFLPHRLAWTYRMCGQARAVGIPKTRLLPYSHQ